MIEEFLKEALQEDWGRGDLFSRVSEDREIEAFILAKSSGIFSGEIYLQTLCKMRGLKLLKSFKDSQSFKKGDILVKISGSYLEILKIERTALNLLQHSSGIATQTRAFVEKIQDYNVRLLDTRKTRPLLRVFEKYSVRNGGASNHRFGLDDTLMLKDTHLSRINDLKSFIRQARKKLPFGLKIEVECEDFEQCKKAFEAQVDIVMCDNMKPEEIIEVVKFRNASYPHILLEASGNLTLENIQDYAKSGVDALSSGSLIHQAVWVDLSLKMIC